MFKKSTEKELLLEKYGSNIILLSSANSYSYERRKVYFKDYVDSMKSQMQSTLGNGNVKINFFY